MRAFIAVALLAVFLSTTVHAQRSNAEHEILAASDARMSAVFRKDEDALDRLQDDDFMLVQDGLVLNKREQILRVLAFNSPDTDPGRDVRLDHISFERNVAVITGVMTITVNLNQFSTAFTEVWVRRGNSWVAKAAHYSTIAPR